MKSHDAHRTLFSAVSLVVKGALLSLVVGFLGACATSTTNKDSLAELCAQEDLSKTSQRVVLAGGYHALANHNLVCAERLTVDARQKDTKDAYAALNLGAVYQRTGRIDQALEQYSAAIALDDQKNQSSSEPAQLATRDNQLEKRPAEIARHNLTLMQR